MFAQFSTHLIYVVDTTMTVHSMHETEKKSVSPLHQRWVTVPGGHSRRVPPCDAQGLVLVVAPRHWTSSDLHPFHLHIHTCYCISKVKNSFAQLSTWIHCATPTVILLNYLFKGETSLSHSLNRFSSKCFAYLFATGKQQQKSNNHHQKIQANKQNKMRKRYLGYLTSTCVWLSQTCYCHA